jgi:hypothetical protein
LKAASTEIPLVTNQRVTRGLFKRLDDVIVWAQEITNPRLALWCRPSGVAAACTRYG